MVRHALVLAEVGTKEEAMSDRTCGMNEIMEELERASTALRQESDPMGSPLCDPAIAPMGIE